MLLLLLSRSDISQTTFKPLVIEPELSPSLLGDVHMEMSTLITSSTFGVHRKHFYLFSVALSTEVCLSWPLRHHAVACVHQFIVLFLTIRTVLSVILQNPSQLSLGLS